MMYKVSSKIQINKIKNDSEYKYKYIISENGIDKYCGLIVNKNYDQIIIYDLNLDDTISEYNWCINNILGYAINTKISYMHTLIVKTYKIPDYDKNNLSIDHINCIKLDNRVKNLRMASKGQQNSNRATRSDKKPPCEELVQIGITELPKYVRWDNSEKKFIIEKHPKLMQEVAEKIRSKAIMSGTKSSTLSIIQKYQDIISRIKELDEKYINPELIAFNKIKEQNKSEYDEICNSIKEYENIELKEKENNPISITIISKRNTLPGRKMPSKLPENCGVKLEDLPKYCSYIPEGEKRGDKFVIGDHPKLIESGKKRWYTTDSKAVTTLQKFNNLMEKYKEL